MLCYGAADGGGLAGELGQPAADGGVMLGLAGIEPGELLGVGGELVCDGGDRVGAGHGQLQGKEVSSPGAHSAGTWSGMSGSGHCGAGPQASSSATGA